MHHVLIIDDDATLLRAARRTVQSFGYKVTTAASADEGLKLLDAGPLDLVITDHSMPEMTGAVLAAALKAKYPSMPVVILTGAPNALELEDVIERGLVTAVVTKPWSTKDLSELLARLLSPAG